ncbi:DUF4160 domain-containing protein [Geomonas diazotrophica]|uniref:DUF4160 domain-containing protein n=1 Tax=Geomonas diazotrophica TaxID=2843197 RepID=UPI001EF033D5|nr:DUF4160 domain-containing protein [Geomonas nitrogeniifigens]
MACRQFQCSSGSSSGCSTGNNSSTTFRRNIKVTLLYLLLKMEAFLEGSLPPAKRKLVEAWMVIHKDELLADWHLAVEGETVFKIKGLE